MSDIFEAPKSNLVDDKQATTEYGSIEKAINGDYEFSIRAVIKEGWEKTSGAKWAIHMAFFWYFLVLIALVILSQVTMVTVIKQLSDPNAALIYALLEQVLFNLVVMPITVGVFILGIKRSVDAPLESTSVFDYFGKMGKLFVTLILVYIMMIIGFILLVIPGIYLSIAYFMAMPLVVEKGLSPWQAMEVSRKAISKRWFSFFFLGMLLSLILVVSMIPLGIGMIWTLPLMLITYGVVYRNMFGVEGATRI